MTDAQILRLPLGPSRQEQLCRHILSERAQGRSVEAILEDDYVVERTAPLERRRLLEDPRGLAELVEDATAVAIARSLRFRQGPALPAA